MDLHLKDRVVLVTGASRGLGKTIALMLAAEGAKVGVNYRRSPEKADAVVRQIDRRYGTAAAVIRGDVSKEADVIGMFDELEKKLGPADALVNNAAFCPVKPTAELSVDDFNYTLQVNMTGTFLASREMVRRLLAGGRHGKIVSISSQAAFRGSRSGKTAYDASKMGIVGFTISLAREVAPQGIAVNLVAPGMMQTEMARDALAQNAQEYMKRIPLRRIADPSEVADAVVYMASERASYITGATLDVTGGMLMR